MVPMTREQYDALNDHVIPSLMRAELTEMATHLMGLSLAYKWAAEPLESLPANVVQFEDYSRKVGA